MDTPNDSCALWRMSFSAAEKVLISHADGKANRKGSKKTFRKRFMQLLKSFLEIEITDALKRHNLYDQYHKSFNSFNLKMLSLNMFNDEKYKKPSMWCYTQLRNNLRYALQELRECVENKKLCHHFVPEFNLLEDLPDPVKDVIIAEIDRALRS